MKGYKENTRPERKRMGIWGSPQGLKLELRGEGEVWSVACSPVWAIGWKLWSQREYRINSWKIFMEHLLCARYWAIGFKYTSMAPVLADPSPVGKADVKVCWWMLAVVYISKQKAGGVQWGWAWAVRQMGIGAGGEGYHLGGLDRWLIQRRKDGGEGGCT